MLRVFGAIAWVIAVVTVAAAGGMALHRWSAAYRAEMAALEGDGRPALAFPTPTPDRSIVYTRHPASHSTVVTLPDTTCPATGSAVAQPSVAVDRARSVSAQGDVQILVLRVDPTAESLTSIVRPADRETRDLDRSRSGASAGWRDPSLPQEIARSTTSAVDFPLVDVTDDLDQDEPLTQLVSDEALEPAPLVRRLERLVPS